MVGELSPQWDQAIGGPSSGSGGLPTRMLSRGGGSILSAPVPSAEISGSTASSDAKHDCAQTRKRCEPQSAQGSSLATVSV